MNAQIRNHDRFNNLVRAWAADNDQQLIDLYVLWIAQDLDVKSSDVEFEVKDELEAIAIDFDLENVDTGYSDPYYDDPA